MTSKPEQIPARVLNLGDLSSRAHPFLPKPWWFWHGDHSTKGKTRAAPNNYQSNHSRDYAPDHYTLHLAGVPD